MNIDDPMKQTLSNTLIAYVRHVSSTNCHSDKFVSDPVHRRFLTGQLRGSGWRQCQIMSMVKHVLSSARTVHTFEYLMLAWAQQGARAIHVSEMDCLRTIWSERLSVRHPDNEGRMGMR